MQTPAILNIANAAPNAKPAQTNGAADGNNSFDRMLSQQLAEKRAAQNNQERRAAQAKPAEKAAEKPASKPQDKATADGATAAEAAKASGAADDSQKTDTGKASTATAAEATPTEQLTATELLASSDLLAMTANPLAAANSLNTLNPANPALRAQAGEAPPLAASNALADALNGATERRGAQAGMELPAQTGATASTAQDSDFAAQLATQTAAATEASAPDTAPADIHPTATALQNMQQGGVENAKAAAPAATHIAPRVGSQGWDQAFGQKVIWMVAGAQQSASLSLNPPDLGPLQVVLNVSNGQADASFFAAQPETRQALEAALPKLREMMSEAGVSLGQATVSTGMPEQQQQQADQQGGRRVARGQDSDDGEAAGALVSQGASSIRSGNGLVDTFA